jgi:hypothetical protein
MEEGKENGDDDHHHRHGHGQSISVMSKGGNNRLMKGIRKTK